jgi:hypothetical protein
MTFFLWVSAKFHQISATQPERQIFQIDRQDHGWDIPAQFPSRKVNWLAQTGFSIIYKMSQLGFNLCRAQDPANLGLKRLAASKHLYEFEARVQRGMKRRQVKSDKPTENGFALHIVAGMQKFRRGR